MNGFDENDEIMAQIQEAEQGVLPTPEAAPVQPEIDPRLQAAMDQRDKQRMFADLLGGFQQLVGAGAAGTGYQPNMDMANELRRRSEDPMKLYQQQLAADKSKKADARQAKQDARQEKMDARADEKHQAFMEDWSNKLRKSQMDITDRERTADPTSPESKLAQDFLLDLSKKQGQPLDEKSVRQVPAAQLYKLSKPMQDLVVQTMKADLAAQQEDRRQKSLQLRERGLDIKEGAEDRRERQFKHKIEEKDELSDKQTEQINAFDTGQNLITKIRDLFPKAKDDLGFYASKFEEGKKFVPGMERDSDFVAMQQMVGTQLADYVKQISGAAVSEEEAQRLAKNIPSVNDKPNEFMRKLDEFEKILQENRKISLDSYKKQGKDPSAFRNESKAGMVQMRIPDGRIKMIPADKVEAAKKAGAQEL